MTRASTCRPRHRFTTVGFSVVELLTVLAVAAILATIGAPSFLSFIQSQKIAAATNELFAAVNLARSEAINRGVRVDLVPAGNQGGWTDGWTVFVDQNANQRPDQGETVIFIHAAVDPDMTIAAAFTDSKVQYVAFNGSGRTRTNASSQTAQAGHWRIDLGRHARKIVINFMGRPRICNPVNEPATC